MINLEENKGRILKGSLPCCPNHFILELTVVGNVLAVSSTSGGHSQVVPTVYNEINIGFINRPFAGDRTFALVDSTFC